jgi:hypothetical protein
MSTPFYDLASLVIQPSGVKAGKVYAQKPLTTDGQLTFSRASTATRVNASGLIETVASNVPRLDYLGSTCPKLQLEPQRSNLTSWSEQASLYSQIGATIGSNVLTSPDGTTNADSIIEDASNGNHVFYNFGATTFTAAAYTASVFAKKGSRDWCALQIYDGTQGFTAFFNLNTGVAGTITGVGTSTITNYGNGWYRCTITGITAAGSSGGIAVYSANADGTTSYIGTNGLTAGYFYGWQLELGAYATSYVKTEGATVTRLGDAASKTGISSLIGQTEGTLFYDGFFGNEATEVYLFLQNGASSGVSDSIYLQRNTNAITLNVFTATLQSFIGGGTFTIGQRVKIAGAYKANDFVLYVNGVQIGTDNTGSVPTCDALQFASYRALPINAEYISVKGSNQALLFKTRLTNAQLAELTSL